MVRVTIASCLSCLILSMDMRRGTGADATCLKIAARNYGVITREQALAAGLSRHQIEQRLTSGAWRVVHKGIYASCAVPRSWHQALLATCLRAGPGAVASHRAAAAEWGLDGFGPSVVEITAPRYVRAEGVVVHRGPVSRRDMGKLRGIPVTGVARTLADLGAVVPESSVEAGLESALRRKLVSFEHLLNRLDDLGGRGKRGAGVLSLLMDDRRTVPTESELERRLEEVLFARGIFPPARQHAVHDEGRFLGRLDFAYPDLAVGIEAESYRWHLDQKAFEKDLARRNALITAGWHVLHFTWGQICRRPHEIWHDVQRALARWGDLNELRYDEPL